MSAGIHKSRALLRGCLCVFAILLAVSEFSLQSEPLGPASRNTGLVISEILYSQPPGSFGTNLDFVEIYNSNPWPEDVGGYYLTGNDGELFGYFPTETVIPGHGFLLLAADCNAIIQRSGLSNSVPCFSIAWSQTTVPGLPDQEGLIQLHNQSRVLLEVAYDNDPPWPKLADEQGYSLVLTRPSLGQGNPTAWSASALPGGSPGRFEPATNNPMKAVVINEVLAHSVEPELDFIELYNRSDQDLDISGCSLSDTARTPKYIFQATVIPAHGYLALDEFVLGFNLRAEGETVYFRGPDQTLLEAFDVEPRPAGVSIGRVPEGGEQLRPVFPSTPFAPNASFYADDIMINEIMFAPLSGDSDDEFVEIYNKSTNTVNLSGWEFTRGVLFVFPQGTTIAPGGFKVVAHNVARFIASYPNLSSNAVAGSFSRALSDDGERIVLSRPVNVGAGAETNIVLVIADDVSYGRWGRWSTGGGSSLELIDPYADNSDSANWADSDESQKASWVSVEVTDWLEHGRDFANELHLFMLGPGECLVDDLEVRSGTSNNLLANPGFESGMSGWVTQGNHSRSTVDAEGCLSPYSLHLRASGPGDTGVNRVEADLLSLLTTNAPVTLRAKVRWLAGHPALLLRLAGNWTEASIRVPVPTNLGTPGLPNSQMLANAGPAIANVRHSPILPTAGQAVVVTAQVHDPDGLGSLALLYRPETGTNAPSFSSLPMVDDGSGGDLVAADGVFSATIPGPAAGTVMGFYLQATDGAIRPASSRFPKEQPLTCLIRFGETPDNGSFLNTRIWLGNGALGEWTTRSRFSDEPVDCTIVYNNERVIYNAGIHYWGDVIDRANFSTPLSDGNRYLVRMPPGETLLGSSTLYLDGATGRNDPTLLREMLAFKLAEAMHLPGNNLSFSHVIVNGMHNTNRNIPLFVMRQVPDAQFIASWLPDSDEGELYRAQPWAEFNDGANPSGTVKSYAMLAPAFATRDGGKKQARYRANWIKEPNSRLDDAYGSLFSLTDILSAPPNTFNDHIRATLDLDEWLGMVALRHLIGDPNGYGYDIGRDAYIFRDRESGWKLLANQLGRSFGLGDPFSAYALAAGDPALSRLLNEPEFQRRYYFILQQALSGPFRQEHLIDSILAPRIDSLRTNGIAIPAAEVTAVENWINARRTFLQSMLPLADVETTVNFDFPEDNNVLRISGTAPLNVQHVYIDTTGIYGRGIEYPTYWTSPTNWYVRFPVEGSWQNVYVRFDGNAYFAGQTNITRSWPIPAVQESMVLNEIMYNPAVPGASYIEIYNRTPFAMSLSRWDLRELDYNIPDGTILHPFQYLVFVENRDAFIEAYGAGIPIAGEFRERIVEGSLGSVTLLKDEIGGGNDNQFVDQIKFETGLPWPPLAIRPGQSMQLIDPAADNSRPCNWSDGTGWRYFTATGIPGTNEGRVSLFLDQPGVVNIDAIFLVEGTQPETGINFVHGGGFEPGLLGDWRVFGTHSNSTASSATAFRGTNSLRLVATGVGGALGQVYQDVTGLDPTNMYTLSFWYKPRDRGSLHFRLGANFRADVAIDPNMPTPTPGAHNTAPYSYQPLITPWISELHITPATNALDNFGEPEPWVELYNAGDSEDDPPLSLEGFYLTDNFTNLTRWAFPPGSQIAADKFKVMWLDGEPAETIPGALHTNFRLNPQGGSIALVQMTAVGPLVVDYVTYTNFPEHYSWASFPENQRLDRVYTATPTPGAPNNIAVFINEWMPVNGGEGVPDPADGEYDDYFELYNANDFPLDLSGFYVSDTVARAKDRLPIGTVIPARGFIVIWADEDEGQSVPAQGQIHVGFRLGRTEEIALFFPNGRTLVDHVAYPTAIDGISQGRYPDGGRNVAAMNAATPKAANDGSPNRAPEFSELMEVTSSTGEVGYTLPVYDRDAPPQTLQYELLSRPTNGTGGLTEWGYFYWNSPILDVAVSNLVTVRVIDDGVPSLSSTGSFWVAIASKPPVFDPVSNAVVVAGTTLTLQIRATDTPGQQVTYWLNQYPDTATINPTNGIFTWTPSIQHPPSRYYIGIIAEDDQFPTARALISFFVDVIAPPPPSNSPPVFGFVSNAAVTAGTTVSRTITATDTPGQRITYSLLAAPSGATISAFGGVFTWTPSLFQPAGRYTVTVQASDDQSPPGRASVTFYIDVTPANMPPVFQPVSNAVISPGSTLTMTITATDAPGQRIVYSLASSPLGSGIDSATGVFTWTPPATQPEGRYYITVRATDDQSPALTGTISFYVDVVGLPRLKMQRGWSAFLISWTTVPGRTYELQCKTNLAQTNWATIVGPFVAQQSKYSYGAPYNGAGRFYRLKTTN